MSVLVIVQGASATVEFSFLDVNGAVVDVSGVQIKAGIMDTTPSVIPSTRVSEGVWAANVNCPNPGFWVARAECSNPIVDAQEVMWKVQPSKLNLT